MSACTVGQQPVGLGQGHAEVGQPQAVAPVKQNPFDMYLESQHPGIYQKADGGYVDAETKQYVKLKDSVVQCYAHVLHPDSGQRGFSIVGTNFIWKVLNEEIRNPLFKDRSPENCKRVFDRVKSYIDPNFEVGGRTEMWKRTQNLFRKYFLSEIATLGQYLTSKGIDKTKAIQAIMIQQNSLADAIGCEAHRQMKIARKETMVDLLEEIKRLSLQKK